MRQPYWKEPTRRASFKLSLRESNLLASCTDPDQNAVSCHSHNTLTQRLITVSIDVGCGGIAN